MTYQKKIITPNERYVGKYVVAQKTPLNPLGLFGDFARKQLIIAAATGSMLLNKILQRPHGWSPGVYFAPTEPRGHSGVSLR